MRGETPGRIEPEKPFYQAYVADNVLPHLHELVFGLANLAIQTDPAVDSTGKLAASLLLGQYQIETQNGLEQGTPVHPAGLPELGVKLSRPALANLVALVGRYVQDAVSPSDLQPAARRKPHVPKREEPSEIDGFRYYLSRMPDTLPEAETVHLGTLVGRARQAEADKKLLADQPANQPARDSLETTIRVGRIAHSSLVESNLRLSVAMAKEYRGRGLDMADLVQTSNEALIDAAWLWDPAKAPFATYACVAMRHRMEKAIAEDAGSISIPSGTYNYAYKNYLSVVSEYRDTHGVYPSEAQLVGEYGYTPTRLQTMRSISQARLPHVPLAMLSADEYIPDEIDDEAMVIAVSQHSTNSQAVVQESAEDTAIREMMNDLVAKADLKNTLATTLQDLAQSKTISDRNAELMQIRWGLTGKPAKNVQETADWYRITPARVRFIEQNIINTLRRVLRPTLGPLMQALIELDE